MPFKMINKKPKCNGMLYLSEESNWRLTQRLRITNVAVHNLVTQQTKLPRKRFTITQLMLPQMYMKEAQKLKNQ